MDQSGIMILLVYLIVMAVYDIRRREIQPWCSAAAAVLLAVRQIYLITQGEVAVYAAFWGTAIGILLILLSILTSGEIGMGDGVLFLISGLLLGIYENSILLFLSLLLTAIVSGVLIVIKRVGRKDTLPFAPFVLAGYGVMCLWKLFG